jgi:hypothetical protein
MYNKFIYSIMALCSFSSIHSNIHFPPINNSLTFTITELTPLKSNPIFIGNINRVMALSATGQYQYIASYNTAYNRLYYSSNFGVNWSSNETIPLDNGDPYVACSISGQIVYVGDSSTFHISTNCGVNFSAMTNPTAPYGFTTQGLCCNSDGSILYVGNSNANIYKSTNFGVTWTTNNVAYNNSTLCCNSTGQYLFGRQNYSVNYGASFSLYASSYNFQYFVCCNLTGQYVYGGTNNALYISTNYGANFTLLRNTQQPISGLCDSTGKNLFYLEKDGYIASSKLYFSNNYGATFTAKYYASTTGSTYNFEAMGGNWNNQLLISNALGGTYGSTGFGTNSVNYFIHL